jgi:hypothetical protein
MNVFRDVSLAGPIFSDRSFASTQLEAALFGVRVQQDGRSDPREVYLLTHQPFAIAILGDCCSGGNRSHTSGCIVESGLIPVSSLGAVRLRSPMDALALFRSRDQFAPPCASAGISISYPENQRTPPAERAVVFTSPFYHAQRAACYGPTVSVRPLHLRWHRLSAEDVRRILGVEVLAEFATETGEKPHSRSIPHRRGRNSLSL